MKCTICVAKTKALIIFAVTAKLICVFVFAYADCWFSHEAAQMLTQTNTVRQEDETLESKVISVYSRAYDISFLPGVVFMGPRWANVIAPDVTLQNAESHLFCLLKVISSPGVPKNVNDWYDYLSLMV